MEHVRALDRIRFGALALACAVFVLASSSCASMVIANPKKVIAVKAKSTRAVSFKKTEYGSPSGHVLAFGLTGVPTVNMAQVDPDLPPVHARLGVAGVVSASKTPYEDVYFYYVVYLPPLAVGSKMATTHMFHNGAYYYYITFPLNGSDGLSFAAAKPGLLYLGDFSPNFDSILSLNGVKKVGSGHELFCLQKILPQFKGTEWEPVIQARIKELSK